VKFTTVEVCVKYCRHTEEGERENPAYENRTESRTVCSILAVGMGRFVWVAKHKFYIFDFFFFPVLVFELRALCLLGRHSTT
jgi:hypothetical protein